MYEEKFYKYKQKIILLNGGRGCSYDTNLIHLSNKNNFVNNIKKITSIENIDAKHFSQITINYNTTSIIFDKIKSFGNNVYLIYNANTNEKYLVKLDATMDVFYYNEMIKKIECKDLCPETYIFNEKNLLMEYMLGSLSDINIPDDQVHIIIKNVVCILLCFIDKSMFYTDIKKDNFLFDDKNNNFNVYITDYGGFSQYTYKKSTTKNEIGQIIWLCGLLFVSFFVDNEYLSDCFSYEKIFDVKFAMRIVEYISSQKREIKINKSGEKYNVRKNIDKYLTIMNKFLIENTIDKSNIKNIFDENFENITDLDKDILINTEKLYNCYMTNDYDEFAEIIDSKNINIYHGVMQYRIPFIHLLLTPLEKIDYDPQNVLKFVQKILEFDSEILFNCFDTYNSTPFMTLCRYIFDDKPNVLFNFVLQQYLTNNKIHLLNHKNIFEETAIFFLYENKNYSLVDVLVSHNVDIMCFYIYRNSGSNPYVKKNDNIFVLNVKRKCKSKINYIKK